MQITITISDEIVRQAQERNMEVLEFVESLIDNGLNKVVERPVLNSAIDRIRALRSTVPAFKP
jgi:hypothetical protein